MIVNLNPINTFTNIMYMSEKYNVRKVRLSIGLIATWLVMWFIQAIEKGVSGNECIREIDHPGRSRAET